MRLKELFENLYIHNDGRRTLLESIVVPEVNQALNDWLKYCKDGILIGGCALSYYERPRATMDVDVLFLSSENIPKNVEKFKKHRNGAFQHNNTHVEIEVVSPESINISKELAQMVYNTANISDGYKVASPSGIIALKLGRCSYQDMEDIANLSKHHEIDLSIFPLSEEELERYDFILKNDRTRNTRI